MRRAVVYLFIFFISLAVFSVKLLNPFGPTILPISFILSGDVGKEIEISFWRSPEEAVASIKAKKADFYILPLTLGANLYNKGFDLVLVGIHEWKVFYLVGREKIDFKELKGKRIYVSHTKGTVVDVLLRYFLEEAGLKPDVDVKLSYLQPNEIVALFKSGKLDYAAIPEPFVTMILANGGKIILDFQKEWAKLTGLSERIPIAGLFVPQKLLKENPLLVEYVELALWVSTDLMNAYPKKASEIAVNYIKMPARILEKSLSRMVFYYMPVEKCKKDVQEFLKVLHEKNPKGMSKIPDEGFYR